MPDYIPKYQKKRTRKKLILTIAALIIAAVVITTLTYAWLEEDKLSPHTLLTGSVTVTPVVYFVDKDDPETIISGENFLYENDGEETHYYIVDLLNEDAENYYERMRVNIKFKGVTKSYIRVHIADMGVSIRRDENYEFKNYIYLKENSDFSINTEYWADNREYDNYYYFIKDMGFGTNKKETVPGIIRSENASYDIDFDFITGFDNVGKNDNSYLYLDITAEAVQFNRIKAFWGIDDLSGIIQ